MEKQRSHGGPQKDSVTRGGQAKADDWFPLVYAELRRRAQYSLGREARGYTLQATELVHEVYLKLSRSKVLTVNDKQHFLALAAASMRRLLVDRARARGTKKRAGLKVPLEDACWLAVEDPSALVELDAALARLEGDDPFRSRVFELKFFGGLSIDEIVETTGATRSKVELGLATATAQLRKAMG